MMTTRMNDSLPTFVKIRDVQSAATPVGSTSLVVPSTVSPLPDDVSTGSQSPDESSSNTSSGINLTSTEMIGTAGAGIAIGLISYKGFSLSALPSVAIGIAASAVTAYFLMDKQ